MQRNILPAFLEQSIYLFEKGLHEPNIYLINEEVGIFEETIVFDVTSTKQEPNRERQKLQNFQ